MATGGGMPVSDTPSPSPSTYDPSAYYHDGFEILLLVLVGVLVLTLLHVLGSFRRRSRDKLLHAVVGVAYSASYSLVSYTVGRMKSSGDGRDVPEFPVWAVSLLLLWGGADYLTASGPSAADHSSTASKNLFHVAWVVWVVALSAPSSVFKAPLWTMLAVVFLKSYAQIASLRTRAELSVENVMWVADYMQREHRLEPAVEPNPVTMEGYRYVVAGGRRLKHRRVYAGRRPSLKKQPGPEKMNITTVEDIWRCEASVLRPEHKDVCLSMALFQMLQRRFAGRFRLAEAGLAKTHDLVFRGLLAGGAGDTPPPHERAFRVVEVELAFVHDLYFTSYPYLYHKGRYYALYLPAAVVSLCCWLTYLLYESFFQTKKRHRDAAAGDMNGIYPVATMVLMAMVTFLEGFQLYLYMASGWFKVAVIRSYVKIAPAMKKKAKCLGSLHQMLVRLLLSLRSLRPWAGELGQYSLLHAVHDRHRVVNGLHYLTLGLVRQAKRGRTRRKAVKLSGGVKEAVAGSLARSDGHLTNGVRSLRENGVHEQLSWACDGATVGSVTETVLLWHVATALCKHQLDAQSKGQSHKEDHRRAVSAAASVAADLSQYCAYLVAFEPSLLPDNTCVSGSVLDESIKEAGDLLRGARSMEKKFGKLMDIAAGEEEDGGGKPLVVLGARLARQLMVEDIQDPALRWRVLSEFWAEMTLYVAPSDDAGAHLEALPRGGEFITHLWALLTHAGVLERGAAGAPPTV